jgi:hypothetical protein
MKLRSTDYVIPGDTIIYDAPLLMTPSRALALGHNYNERHSYTAILARMAGRLPDDYHDRSFLIQFGDGEVELAGKLVVAKTHRLGGMPTVILPFDWDRHFFDMRELLKEGDNLTFKEKRPLAYWRGASTNNPWDPSVVDRNPRMQLVRRWSTSTSNLVDIALSDLVQEAGEDRWRSHWEEYVKPYLGWKEQLQFRYLISVEGNDVASGLKWQLGSNSVVIMPSPTIEIWTMESCLEPWVHYVPVKNDFSDLEDRILECERDLDRCQKIAEAATEFVRWYADEDRTIDIGAARLKLYLDRVKVEII